MDTLVSSVLTVWRGVEIYQSTLRAHTVGCQEALAGFKSNTPEMNFNNVCYGLIVN
jgi:hypothetical protein